MTTPNLGLSFMATSSLSKEAIFNEAIIAFDALLGGIVLGIQNSPPGTPADGDSYIVGTAGTGAWSGHNNEIAFYYNGWRFIAPVTKMRLFSNAQDAYYQFNGTTWVAIPTPAVAELDDLDDVHIDTPEDGHILVYVAANNRWENTSSALTIEDIGDLGDVDTATNPPTDGQVLVWDNDNSKWVPGAISFTVEMSTLTDVNVAGRADGQILVWDEDTGEHVYQDPVFSTTVDQLNDIGDVSAENPGTGDALIWNGGAWVPGGVPAQIDGSTDLADGFAGNANKILRLDPTEQELIWVDHTIAALLDFDNDPAPTDGQFMRYRTSDSKWYPATVSVPSNISDLADVDAGAPSTGQVLTWSGSEWAPANIPTQLVDWKDSVQIAIGTNIDIAGGGLAAGTIIQGVTLIAGKSTLLYGQANPEENGIYTIPAAGAASRRADADATAEVTTGLTVPVEEGDHAGEFFVLTTVGTITVGTTALTFQQFSAGGADELAELLDVTITTPEDGHVLVYDTDEWVNRALNISDLGDVDLTTPPTDGQVLVWDEGTSTWIPGDTGIATLDDVGDVDLTGIADGNVLVWDAGTSTWLPGVVAAYPDMTGNAAKVLAVNATEDGVEWVDQTGGGGSSVLTINTQTDSYELALEDGTSTYVRMNVAGANNLTVPANTTVAFPVGTSIPIRQAGAGQTTVVAAVGVTINTPETLKLRKQGSGATLIKVAEDEWDLVGDLELA